VAKDCSGKQRMPASAASSVLALILAVFVVPALAIMAFLQRQLFYRSQPVQF